ncbi:MAG TPA: hypothetical protein VIE86_04085 [Nitrososphaera sp.]
MLCRACGGDMIATEYCDSCNEGILWKCIVCDKINDKSVHTYHPPLQEEFSTVAPTSVVGILATLVSGLTAVAQI